MAMSHSKCLQLLVEKYGKVKRNYYENLKGQTEISRFKHTYVYVMEVDI